MTKEDYRRHTGIASAEEAKMYLSRMTFWFLFMGILVAADVVFTRTLSLPIQAGLRICLFALFIWFVVECWRLKRKLKIVQTKLLWMIVYVSWPSIYFQLTRPLRIITGEYEPPAALPTKEEREQKNKGSVKRLFKTIGLIALGTAILMIVVGVVVGRGR